jgi:hypothetical protein
MGMGAVDGTSAEIDHKAAGGRSSPIAAAVRTQIFGDLSPEASSPAIFLMAHQEFLPAALRAAAGIYRRQNSSSAAVLADLLSAEADRRRTAEATAKDARHSVAPVAAEHAKPAAAVERPLGVPDPIQAVAVEIQKQFGMRLPLVFDAETESAYSEGWLRVAQYVFGREQALLAKLMTAVGALRTDAALDKGALAALREIQHLSHQIRRLIQGLRP